MTKIVKIVLGTIIISIGLFISYVMPSYDQVYITGMEVKRMDKDGVISKTNPADGQIRDVYFLFVKDRENKVNVFRNEDTAFSFPFYFKFNSADIQAIAQSYTLTQNLVEVKYYGWRISYLSEFGNVLSIRELEDYSDRSLPIFSYIIYALLLTLWIYCNILITRRENEN